MPKKRSYVVKEERKTRSDKQIRKTIILNYI